MAADLSISVTLLASAAVLLAYFFRRYLVRTFHRNTGLYPPGPTALPVLGTVCVDRERPHLTFHKWAHQYGKVFSFCIGDRFCVGVADTELIKKLFKEDKFSGRPKGGLWPLFDGNLHKGLVLADSEFCKQQRKFSVNVLREFGIGKSSGIDYVQEETGNLLSFINNQAGAPFDPRYPFARAVSNVVARVLFGAAFSENDVRFRKFIDSVSQNMKDMVSMAPLDACPWIRHVPPFNKRFRNFNFRAQESLEALEEIVQEHKRTLNETCPRDYIDAYLLAKHSPGDEALAGDAQLVLNIHDLFTAGYEATTTFLRWAMICIILNPEVQTKMQIEIDSVVERSRLPHYSDRAQLPFCEAVILEVFRLTTFLPFGVPHRATEDAEVEGYLIPKDTEIWSLWGFCNNDPEKWEKPERFKPERFLDVDGKVRPDLADEVQPYSAGKRACLGEALARTEVFGFLTAIIQHFTIESKKGELPSMAPVIAAVLRDGRKIQKLIPVSTEAVRRYDDNPLLSQGIPRELIEASQLEGDLNRFRTMRVTSN